jgi:tRNA threonylcarbamoyladenosine biosynthesis protein TsaE
VALGESFANILKEKDVVLLEGDLGGGKTTFIKGVCKGFRCRQRVLSPSFTLLRRYKIKSGYIYHVDLYRLDNHVDMFGLGLEDYLYAKGSITLIEWGEKIEETLPQYIKMKFSFLGENERKIVLSLKGYKKDKIVGARFPRPNK